MNTERDAKKTALLALAANYGSTITRELGTLWLQMLEQYTAAQVQAGVIQVMREYEYKTLPTFATLEKAIRKASGILEQEDAIRLAALKEWDALLDNVARYGRNGNPPMHEITAYVVRNMGGWCAVCDWETSKLEWRKKDFVETWLTVAPNWERMALPTSDVLALAGGNARRQPQIAQHVSAGIGATMAQLQRGRVA